MNINYQLQHDARGRLTFTGEDGQLHEAVVPVRAFPIAAPDEGVALVDPHGHELAWIDRLSELPQPLRTLIESVSSYATPSTWQIVTDHGDTALVLKGEEDIRRLAPPALLITDSNGINYLIHDRYALDKQSRKILDRFL